MSLLVYHQLLNEQGHQSLMENILNSIEVNRPTGDNPPAVAKDRDRMWNNINGVSYETKQRGVARRLFLLQPSKLKIYLILYSLQQ